MAKTKKVVSLLTITTLVAPVVAGASEGVVQNQKQEQKSQASQMALEQSTSTLLSLVIATQKVEKSAGKLVQLDPAVEKKYTVLRTAYLGSVPTGLVTMGAGSLGVESVRRVEFVLKPLTLILRAIQEMGKVSVNAVDKFSVVTGLDKVLTKSFDASADSMEFTYKNLIKPVLEVLITKNTAISSGSVSATAVATGSIFFMRNNAQDAMTIAEVRNILGQDRIIKSRIDGEVQGIAEIYNLSADQQADLKIAIYDDIIRQAVINNFSDDSSKYQLDVLKLMADKKIVDTTTVEVVQKIRSVVAGLTKSTVSDVSTRTLTLQNTEMALQLASMLESQLIGNNIKDPKLRSEVERMLGSVAAKLSMIGFNLKK